VKGCGIRDYGDGEIGHGINFFRGCKRCRAVGNSVSSEGEDCHGIAVDAGTTGSADDRPSVDCVVTGNHIQSVKEGIFLEGAHSPTVTANTVGPNVEFGVYIDDDQGGKRVRNASIIGNTITEPGTDGISVLAVRGATIAGNNIEKSGSRVRRGIMLQGGQSSGDIRSVTICGNQIRGFNRGVQVWPEINTIRDVVIVGNVLTNQSEDGVRILIQSGNTGDVRRLLVANNEINDQSDVGTDHGVNILFNEPNRVIEKLEISRNLVYGISGDPVGGDTAQAFTINGVGNQAVGGNAGNIDTSGHTRGDLIEDTDTGDTYILRQDRSLNKI